VSGARRVRPWPFVIRRWFRCWRGGHAQLTFSTRYLWWTECYCGLRGSEVKGRRDGLAGVAAPGKENE
jgi:hypothetical protein